MHQRCPACGDGFYDYQPRLCSDCEQMPSDIMLGMFWDRWCHAWKVSGEHVNWEGFYRSMGGDNMVWAWKRQMAREIELGHRTRTGQRWNARNWHQP